MKFDSIDRLILGHLQANAAISIGDLADLVSISKSACWRRVQKLEQEKVIKQRVTLLNPEKINLPLTVYVSVRTNQHNAEWSQKFRAVVADLPEILEVYRMSGDLDYLIKATVSDMPDYDKLYQQLIKAELFDVSSSFVMEVLKQTTELPLTRV